MGAWRVRQRIGEELPSPRGAGLAAGTPGHRAQGEVAGLLDRIDSEGGGPAAEALRGDLILDLEHRLARPRECRVAGRRVVRAFAELEALLVDRIVEAGLELRDLAEVVLERDREAVAVGDPGQSPVEDELIAGADVPSSHPVPLCVGVDDVVLDAVETGAGALRGAGLDSPEDEVALAAAVLQVEPVLVRESAAERLADQAVVVAPVEADVLVVVGPEALGGAG